MMTETQFLMALNKTTTAYTWTVEGKKIVGTAKNGKTRGKKFNPLTAVCRSSGLGNGTTTQAAKKLGVTTSLKDSILEITEGRGADVIYDPVGGELFEQCLRAVAWCGRILIIGFTSGKISTVPANLPLLKGSSIIGVFWGRFTDQEPKINADNTTRLFQLLQQGKLKPHISKIYPLEQSTMALEILEKRRVKGKVIIKI